MKRRILPSREIVPAAKETAEQTEKLDPLMRAIKAVRSNGGTADPNDLESIEKQRHNQERLSKLVTPAVNVSYEKDTAADLPVLWARPEYPHRTDRCILYCHGGGFTCGELGYAGILAGKLASHTGLEVLTFQYRLAPEHPYPCAIEDTMAIWDYLMYMGYGAEEITVAGDSAGGNLVLQLVSTLQKQGRRLPRALVLMSPWTDMTATSSSYEKYKDLDPMLTKEYILGVRAAYAGADADFKDPSLSPLYGELTNMPPTFIQVGSNEILRADSENLYKKLHRNECLTRLVIYNGCWHVFQQMPTPKAHKAMDDIADFMAQLQ